MFETPELVRNGDKVQLRNQFDEARGWLDAWGHTERGGYDVETSQDDHREVSETPRAGGTGTWQIVKEKRAPKGSIIRYGEPIMLVNQKDPTNGFLVVWDDLMYNPTNGYGVETSSNPNDKGKFCFVWKMANYEVEQLSA